jgi:hypothetical protein
VREVARLAEEAAHRIFDATPAGDSDEANGRADGPFPGPGGVAS